MGLIDQPSDTPTHLLGNLPTPQPEEMIDHHHEIHTHFQPLRDHSFTLLGVIDQPNETPHHPLSDPSPHPLGMIDQSSETLTYP